MTHIGQLLHGPNALWPTQSKFWVSHSPSGVLGGLESLSVKTEPSHSLCLAVDSAHTAFGCSTTQPDSLETGTRRQMNFLYTNSDSVDSCKRFLETILFSRTSVTSALD